ncbi:MAG TPA: hypothetical protein VLA14_10200 [Polyangia bacterium]|jgi:hypothetical protein|nr:hypothetical protein [Polyangia bacterium]
MTKQRLLRAIAALGLGLVLVGAPTIANAAPVAPSAPALTTATKDTTPNDGQPRRASYAAREAAAPHAADFKGNGAGIYIGGSTVAVVLVIVLILVLL